MQEKWMAGIKNPLGHTRKGSCGELSKQKVPANVINGIAFYTALDQDRFRLGSQYRHIHKLKNQLNSAF